MDFFEMIQASLVFTNLIDLIHDAVIGFFYREINVLCEHKTFFKANARLWRNLSSPEFDYYVAVQDPHPLDYLRANVVEQQYEEFYETFGVEEGDGMYLAPQDRIAVW